LRDCIQQELEEHASRAAKKPRPIFYRRYNRKLWMR